MRPGSVRSCPASVITTGPAQEGQQPLGIEAIGADRAGPQPARGEVQPPPEKGRQRRCSYTDWQSLIERQAGPRETLLLACYVAGYVILRRSAQHQGAIAAQRGQIAGAGATR